MGPGARSSPIRRFLEGDGVDRAGRTIAVVLAFGDADLERHHDFIQWLFPLPEPSAAVPGSPVLTAADVEALKGSPRAQSNLAAAAARMGLFYDRTDHWLRHSDHNHRRISRIIRSLRILVGDPAADRFRDRILGRVETSGTAVSAASRRHWMLA